MWRGQHQAQEAGHHQGPRDPEAGGCADGQVGGAHTLAQDIARHTRVKPGVTRLHLKNESQSEEPKSETETRIVRDNKTNLGTEYRHYFRI